MRAMMGGMSDFILSDIVGGVNTGGYKKGYAESSEPDGGMTRLGDYSKYAGNSNPSDRPSPIGTKLPNELGLYDLSENVLSWVWDAAGNYPSGSVTNYQGPSFTSSYARRLRFPPGTGSSAS